MDFFLELFLKAFIKVTGFTIMKISNGDWAWVAVSLLGVVLCGYALYRAWNSKQDEKPKTKPTRSVN
jgi:hypothetical protein